MNKTVVAVAIVVMVTVMFSGVILVALFRPDATATIIAFVGSTVTTIVGVIVIIYNLDKVIKQTNGINSVLLSKATGASEDTIERAKGNK